MKQQLTIFNFLEDDSKIKEITAKDILREKLDHYGIDEIYQREFKGQSSLLRNIKERLEKEANYKDYMEDLITRLLKIFPLIDNNFRERITGIFKYNNYVYGYKTSNYSCPLYCLEMIPSCFFEDKNE